MSAFPFQGNIGITVEGPITIDGPITILNPELANNSVAVFRAYGATASNLDGRRIRHVEFVGDQLIMIGPSGWRGSWAATITGTTTISLDSCISPGSNAVPFYGCGAVTDGANVVLGTMIELVSYNRTSPVIDPGTENFQYALAVMKYDGNREEVWRKVWTLDDNYFGTQGTRVNAFALYMQGIASCNAASNSYVFWSAYTTGDGVQSRSFVSKLSNDGDFLWHKAINLQNPTWNDSYQLFAGDGRGMDLYVDSAENVYFNPNRAVTNNNYNLDRNGLMSFDKDGNIRYAKKYAWSAQDKLGGSADIDTIGISAFTEAPNNTGRMYLIAARNDTSERLYINFPGFTGSTTPSIQIAGPGGFYLFPNLNTATGTPSGDRINNDPVIGVNDSWLFELGLTDRSQTFWPYTAQSPTYLDVAVARNGAIFVLATYTPTPNDTGTGTYKLSTSPVSLIMRLDRISTYPYVQVTWKKILIADNKGPSATDYSPPKFSKVIIDRRGTKERLGRGYIYLLGEGCRDSIWNLGRQQWEYGGGISGDQVIMRLSMYGNPQATPMLPDGEANSFDSGDYVFRITPFPYDINIKLFQSGLGLNNTTNHDRPRLTVTNMSGFALTDVSSSLIDEWSVPANRALSHSTEVSADPTSAFSRYDLSENLGVGAYTMDTLTTTNKIF
jgi:hypothetical protein